MVIFTLDPIRRKHYDWFRYTHLLFLLGGILAVVHYSLLAGYASVGLALYVIDYGLLARHAFKYKTRIVSARLIGDGQKMATTCEQKHADDTEEETQSEDQKLSVLPSDSDSAIQIVSPTDTRTLIESKEAHADRNMETRDSSGELYMEIVIRTAPLAGPGARPFSFDAGQYILLLVPSLSYLAHPFSLASPACVKGVYVPSTESESTEYAVFCSLVDLLIRSNEVEMRIICKCMDDKHFTSKLAKKAAHIADGTLFVFVSPLSF